jgi:hypothetical protein
MRRVFLATIVDVDAGSGAVPPEYAACPFAPPKVVFSVNFTPGYAYGDDFSDTLYGLEWNGGTGPMHLPLHNGVKLLRHRRPRWRDTRRIHEPRKPGLPRE